MSRRSIPVLVVGAGPAGLASAAELSHHGVACVVVEPRTWVDHARPRAKTTSVRTMELFRRWGVAEQVREAAPLSPEWSDRVVFCDSLSGDLVTSFEGCFGLRSEDVAAERGQQIPQPRVEEVLRDQVGSSDEVDLVLGARVTDLDEHDDVVVATVQHEDGRTERVEAQWVLGCDGPNGITRASRGIDLLGDSDPRPNFNIIFRAPDLTTDLGPAVQYWAVGADFPGVIGRLDLDGTWWAIAPGVEAVTGAADPSAIVEALVGRPVQHEVLATDPWTARMLVAERYRTDRIFLVGDAAHMNPPWGGHGYNTSVGDAVNIAWKVAAVLHGWGGQGLLESYEVERRPVAEETIRLAVANMSTLATDLARGPAQDRQALAASIQASKRAEFHSLGLVKGYAYDGSPVVAPTSATEGGGDRGGSAGTTPGAGDLTTYVPSSAPGCVLPHAVLPDGRPLYDHLGPELSVVGPVRTDPTGIRELQDRARALGVCLQLVEPPTHYPWAGEFLLVRPDQYIADRAVASSHGLDLHRAVGRTSDRAEAVR